MDWEKLKIEYITTKTSYRKLAEKYNVSFAVLRRVAEKEKWTKLKTQTKQKADTKLVNSVAKDMVKHSIKINDVADKLLDKIVMILDEFEGIDSQAIKQLTSSLKDIKDIKGIKSEIDLKEQEARIDKLRKDIESEKPEDEKPYGVVLMPPIMDAPVPPSEEESDGQ